VNATQPLRQTQDDMAVHHWEYGRIPENRVVSG